VRGRPGPGFRRLAWPVAAFCALGWLGCRKEAPPALPPPPPSEVQVLDPWSFHFVGGLLVITGETADPVDVTLKGTTLNEARTLPFGPVRWELLRPPKGEVAELRSADGTLLFRFDFDKPPPPRTRPPAPVTAAPAAPSRPAAPVPPPRPAEAPAPPPSAVPAAPSGPAGPAVPPTPSRPAPGPMAPPSAPAQAPGRVPAAPAPPRPVPAPVPPAVATPAAGQVQAPGRPAPGRPTLPPLAPPEAPAATPGRSTGRPAPARPAPAPRAPPETPGLAPGRPGFQPPPRPVAVPQAPAPVQPLPAQPKAERPPAPGRPVPVPQPPQQPRPAPRPAPAPVPPPPAPVPPPPAPPVAAPAPKPAPAPAPVPKAPPPAPVPAAKAPAPPPVPESAARDWPGAGEGLNLLRGPKGDRRICMTFDGGSSNEVAVEVLDALKAHGIRTTLFLTGEFIRKYPDLVRRMDREGHELGNHTLDHPHFAPGMRRDPRWTRDRFQQELLDADRNLFRLIGRPFDPYWRAPYGEHTLELRKWAEELGYRHVGWSEGADTLDWATVKERRLYRTGDAILDKLRARMEKQDGDGLIVLMHLGSGRPSGDRPAQVLGPFLDRALRDGWHFVPISEYLKGLGKPRWEPVRRAALLR